MRPSIIRALYWHMLRIRMVEERIASEYPRGEIRCPTHLSIGQEAIAVGVCAHLRKEDIVLSTHRCHAHYLAKGGSLPAMIAELYGRKTGCSRGFGGSMRLVDLSVNFFGATPIVGNSIPVAVGTGFAGKLEKRNRISVAFFGEAATEEGVFYESVNFAVLYRLPVLFVCENNFYSVNTPLRKRQPSNRKIHTVADALGAHTYSGEGNDVITVSKRAAKAIAAIRSGEGPQCIVFETYRMREHCGVNSDTLRPKAEMAYWTKKDPLRVLETYNKKIHALTLLHVRAIKEKITREIDAAFAFAKSSPYPEGDMTKELTYAA